MRIGFAIYGNLDLVSGGFVYDRALIGALTSLGHQVDVHALPWLSYGRALASNLKLPPRPARGSLPRCDVLIEDELIHPSLLRGAAFWRGRFAPPPRSDDPAAAHPLVPPRVALIHNLRSQQPDERLPRLKALVEGHYLRHLNGAIAVCDDSWGQARALAGPALRGLVVHAGRDHLASGSDHDQPGSSTSADTTGALRILHVAAVVPHKGLHRLIAALARAPGLRFRLDVVGDLTQRPDYVRSLQLQAREGGIASHIRWHGQQRGQALATLYRDAQLFALPSDREAYSLACLEALGFGVAVLATAHGGLGEMFSHGTAGLLLDPEDCAAWTQALCRLAADRPQLARMSAAARACHLRHRTWQQVALAVQQFLWEVVARSPPASPA